MKLSVNDDPNRAIEFDPTDKDFIIRVLKIDQGFEMKKADLQERLKKDKSKEADLVAEKEMCVFMRGQIDYVFGTGTSQKVFGDTATMKMISQFLDGIASNINAAKKNSNSRLPGNRNMSKKSPRHSHKK
jgi:hypothetical protein